MVRMHGRIHFWAVVSLVGLFATQAAADPPDILRNYRFIPSHSSVHVTGGFAGFDMDLSIEGGFGLVTGYDYDISPTTHVPILVRHAEFVDVNAILFNPLSMAPRPVPGWDLDQTLSLSGLAGTFQDPSLLSFTGVEGQGWPIKLQATIHDRLLHLTGENDPGCCDFFGYKVDAFAHLAPYADFNLDGVVDRADVNLLLVNIGLSANASFEQGDADGDGDVDGDDFLTWQGQVGTAVALSSFTDATGATTSAAPEPATVAVLLSGSLALLTWRFRAASTLD